MAYPLFFLPIYLSEIYYSNFWDALLSWTLIIVLTRVAFSIIVGVFLGYIAKEALYYSRNKALIDKESFLAYSIALCALSSGLITYYLEGNDLIAIFAAGLTLSWHQWFIYEIKDEKIQEVLDLLLNLAYFLLFGSFIPWDNYAWLPISQLTNKNQVSLYSLLPLTISIILFRRLPLLFILRKFIPGIKTVKEALFVGWFGPIGVGALYYAQLFLLLKADDISATFYSIIYFIVFSSVIVHGFTVPLFNLTLRATMSITSVNVDLLSLLPTPDLPNYKSPSEHIQSSLFKSSVKSLSIHTIDYLSFSDNETV